MDINACKSDYSGLVRLSLSSSFLPSSLASFSSMSWAVWRWAVHGFSRTFCLPSPTIPVSSSAPRGEKAAAAAPAPAPAFQLGGKKSKGGGQKLQASRFREFAYV